MLREGCEGPCSWFAECQAMCDSKLPCGISLDNVEASLRSAQLRKGKIIAVDCGLDEITLHMDVDQCAGYRIGEVVAITSPVSANTARDAIATIIWDAVKEFDEKSTVNANDYADQVLRYMATAPVA